MQPTKTYLISQRETPLVLIDASSDESALTRAKGVGHIVDFDPSLPLTAKKIDGPMPNGIPHFLEEYFQMLGFTS